MNRPFDEAKYNALLKGLEANELTLSKVREESENFRIDSEYFKKIYLQIVEKLKILSSEKFSESIVSKIIHPVEIERVYEESGIQIMLAQNVRDNLFDFSVEVFMDRSKQDELTNNKVDYDDVILTRSGANYGQNACYKYKKEIFACADVLVLKPNNTQGGYLSTFLNTYYGRQLLNRGAYGMAQPHIAPPYLWSLLLPRFEKLEKVVDKLVIQSVTKLEESKVFYNEAENLLLEAVGLKDFEPDKEKTNVKNFSESFLLAERIDAEFYLPKYDEIENKLKQNHTWNTIGNLQTKLDTGEYAPNYYQNDEIKGLTFYIRSTNIKNGQIELDDDYYVTKKDFVRIAKKSDIVTARVGSVGLFGEIREDLDGAVYSDNILCFRLPDSFIPSIYTMLFNSKYYFDLIDRLARGSVQQRLNQETLKDLIVPIIETEKQNEISELIEESFRLKKESENLLETAKRAVEIAIEETEESAMEFINAFTI